MITTATLQSYGVRQTCYYSLQTNWNGCMCGCVNVLHTHLVKERNEYGYVCLTHVEGWPVKNNVITNREWNKKRRWSKEKTNNNTSDFFGCQVPDDREWRNRYLDLAREEEQANDQMKKGGRMQEHPNGYQYHGSGTNIIICCSFSVVRFWYQNQFNAYFLLFSEIEIERRRKTAMMWLQRYTELGS